MHAIASAPVHRTRRSIEVILLTGLVAATLDILDPIIFVALKGVAPIRVLQAVASGLMGKAAFEGGAASAALGLVAHYLIMFVIVAIYYAASRRLPILTRRPLVCGPLFGLCVYVVMEYVVVPLSAAPMKPPSDPAAVVNQLFAMTVLVGTTISVMVARLSINRS